MEYKLCWYIVLFFFQTKQKAMIKLKEIHLRSKLDLCHRIAIDVTGYLQEMMGRIIMDSTQILCFDARCVSFSRRRSKRRSLCLFRNELLSTNDRQSWAGSWWVMPKNEWAWCGSTEKNYLCHQSETEMFDDVMMMCWFILLSYYTFMFFATHHLKYWKSNLFKLGYYM